MKTVWNLLKEASSKWSDNKAPRLGAALAFYTMLSVAPLMVVSIAIAGFVFGQAAAQGRIFEQLRDVIGQQGAATVQSLVQHASKPGSGIAATVIGLVVLLFGASGVFGELRDSLNTVWGVQSADGGGLTGLIKQRFASFAMVLGTGFLLLVSLILSAAIAAAGRYFGAFLPVSEVVLQLANVAFSFATVTALFALIYKVVPESDVRWRDVWVGAAITSLLFAIGKMLIGLYLGKATIGSSFGAAGSLVVFIVWVYYSAQIFLLGAEFTHTFSERHGTRAQRRREQETPPWAAGTKYPNPRLV